MATETILINPNTLYGDLLEAYRSPLERGARHTLDNSLRLKWILELDQHYETIAALTQQALDVSPNQGKLNIEAQLIIARLLNEKPVYLKQTLTPLLTYLKEHPQNTHSPQGSFAIPMSVVDDISNFFEKSSQQQLTREYVEKFNRAFELLKVTILLIKPGMPTMERS